MAALLEVIVLSVHDAVEAARGGAGRLEVVRDLDREGLTPTLDLVAEILTVVDIPVRVMLREREEHAGHQAVDLEDLAWRARAFAALPIDGFVLGLLARNEVDVEALEIVLAGLPSARVTFHRAFEEVPDAARAIRTLKRDPRVDRVLATGGRGPWTDRATRVAAAATLAAPEITAIAAGGIDVRAIRHLRGRTPVSEFHVGRAARPGRSIREVVSRELVAQLVEACRE